MIPRPWTDDLPKCRNTCVGQYVSRNNASSSTNEECLCFYCELEGDSYLYGVFDPHNGVDAARFVMQRMAAEILFQPIANSTEDEIRDILRNAFVSVEKAYIENYDGMIAERTSLQYQLQTLNDSQISQSSDSILQRLMEIDQHLSCGVTVVIALVHKNQLYVANVGEARALLCRTDENSVLRVVQLSIDHSLENEDELLRLRQLGLDVNKLRNAQYLGNQSGTRALGNYLVKGLYKAFPDMRTAHTEPVISTSEVHGPIAIDESCRFLVLVSAGVYKRLQELKGNSEQTNKQLAQIIVENFRKQTDYNQISQDVLAEIENEFRNYCLKNHLTPKPNTMMSLLIRNFNFPLPNSQYDSNSISKQNVRFNPIVQSKSNTLVQVDYDTAQTDDPIESNRSNTSSEYSNGDYSDGKNRRIKGYVDFSCYYENVEKARQNGTLPSFLQ